MKTQVYQAQEKGCGYAAIKMALIYMSHDKRHAFLREPVVESAPDLDHLISYARDAGLRLRAYAVDNTAELLQNTEFPLLVILHEKGRQHMVFLLAHRRGKFIFLDPAKGKRFVDDSDMILLWTGCFLRIEGYEKKGELSFWDQPVIPLLPARLVLALLPMAFLMLSFILLFSGYPTFFVVIAMVTSLACSMIEKVIMLRAMERFDTRYMDGVDAKFLKKRRDLYVHYQAYKRAAIVSRSEVLGHFLSVFAALTFLVFADPYLAAAAAISLILVCFLHAFLDPKKKTLEQKCESLEGTYFFALVDEGRRKELRDELRACSRKYSVVLSSFQGLFIAFSVGLAILFCLAQGVFTAQILIFYMLTLLFVANEGDKLYQSQGYLELKKKEEPYFILNISSRVN